MEGNVKILLGIAHDFSQLKQNDNLVVERLKSLSVEELDFIINSYANSDEKINKIRLEVAKKSIKSGNISNDTIESIKQAVNNDYPTNILHAWASYFSLFYPFFYHNKKQKVNDALIEISQNLISALKLDDQVKFKYVGFDGSNNFGSDTAWIAIYNQSQPNQSSSLQLQVNFSGEGLTYGLYEHLNTEQYRTHEQQRSDSIDYARMVQFLYQSRQEIIDDSEVVSYWKLSPGENACLWDKMFEKGIASVGWGNHDFTGKTRNEISQIDPGYFAQHARSASTLALLQQVRVGDVVFAFNGRRTVLAVGKVKSLPTYSQEPLIDDCDHHNYFSVTWDKFDPPKQLRRMVATDALANITEMREELSNLLDDGNTEEGNMKSTSDAPLNNILYGPPGTGKTYNTIIEAVKICETDFKGLYEDAKARYKELKAEGRIEFITFHQSYGYEEFIEGIKALTKNENITYSVEDGLLKKMAINAMYAGAEGDKEKEVRFYDLYERLVSIIKDREEPLQLETKGKKTIKVRSVSSANSLHCYHEDSDIKYTVSQTRLKKLFDTYDSRDKLGQVSNLNEAFTNVIGGANQTVYWAALSKLLSIREELEEDADGDPSYESKRMWVLDHEWPQLPDNASPYVLIIDEINRGNISKIFGELITLIEEDKRIGAEHAMTVRLPVSGEEFGLPSNLHIIGTMNTADRSIAMMDTALRRRFEFEEMMPNPELLKDISIEGVGIKAMLEEMNQRIEVLYDREHTIGHAYFMELKSTSKIKELASIFKNKIIPLLEEYFFEDWEKIRLVLGDNQKTNIVYQFIQKRDVNQDKMFGENCPDDIILEDLKIFKRNTGALSSPDSYIGIYDQKNKDEAKPESETDGDNPGNE